MKKILPLFLLICSSILFFTANITGAITHKNTGTLYINFNHTIQNKPLLLDTILYTNALNQPYSITKLKYYISNICLYSKNGKCFKSNQYFLINEQEPDSKLIQLKNIPNKNYHSISFIIGVDSLNNCSGAQSGALDPLNAMFWTWNTGYIFFKLEGYSPNSSATDKSLEYHIGGYRSPNNCIKTIYLTPKNTININKNTPTYITLNANIDEFFKNPYNINFLDLPTVNNSFNATKIADNYFDIFSILN